MREKLFYILFYFKGYPTFDLAAVLCDFDRSQANRWLHRWQPILEGVKRANAVSDVYRNRLPNFDDRLILTACGLWNFYLEAV